MTRVPVKGIKKFRDRHGKLRVYHRKTGTPIKAPFGSGEFFIELARLEKLVEMSGEHKPGTLGKVIKLYRADPRFTELAPRTRQDYQKVFDYLQPIQGTPLTAFETPLVVRIRDKAAKSKGAEIWGLCAGGLVCAFRLVKRTWLYQGKSGNRNSKDQTTKGSANRKQAVDGSRASRSA